MNINDYKKVTDRLEPDEKCKNEVLNMNKRKQNIEQKINDDVSGVDVRSGRNITRYVGIAAACVLLAVSIGSTGLLLHKSKKEHIKITELSDPTTTFVSTNVSNNATSAKTTKTDPSSTTTKTTEVTTEKTTEEHNDSSYESIAMKIIENYYAGDNLLMYGDISYDTNCSINFTTYDGFDDVCNSSFCGERKFYKVTDERFKSCQDIYDYYKSFLTSIIKMNNISDIEEYELPESYTDAEYLLQSISPVKSFLGGDISKYESGSQVNVCPEIYNVWDKTARAVNYAKYVEYKGDLYVAERRDSVDPMLLNPVFTFGPIIKDITENSFSAIIFRKTEDFDTIKYGSKETYYFVLEDGEWKINNLIFGEYPELDSSRALIKYLDEHKEYSDVCRDFYDVEHFIEIFEYDIDAQTCKVHGVLHNMYAEDVIDVTADIDLNNISVTSADIKRIK
ncbi:MAG: hypothetical protein K6G33_13280 [Ruminococcus sp.]|uniref:hypothetical protein n=1 Tax=Ruminococcus sp. TaxID=41978 RepID=UPI0025D03343|nr:hypothetical protein [Ruminococcus sp.]MCR5601702.1 hypothetical protein [Ruminococcus sp.]